VSTDDEQAGRERANSLPASANYGWTQASDAEVREGIARTGQRLSQAANGEQVFAAARDNQRWLNEAARRGWGRSA
jgi:hypothetical protein